MAGAFDQKTQLCEAYIEEQNFGRRVILIIQPPAHQGTRMSCKPSAKAKSPPLPSTVPSGGKAPNKSKLAHDAQHLFKHSKGRMRIPLEDCGPATFNRFGQPLSGRHACLNMTRICKNEGFATYRYYAGYAHTPPKNDPLIVYRHGQAMADRDSTLPRFESKALYGVFRKTHLFSACLKIKQGSARYMNEQGELTTELMLVPPDEAELREVMDKGLWMEIWDYEFVMENMEAFKALMASDNYDAGYGLAEDEQCLCARMFMAKNELRCQPGVNQWTGVLAETLKFAGKQWQEDDLKIFWDFVKTVPKISMDYWQALHRVVCDPAVFEVTTDVFKNCFNKMDPKYVYTRLAFLVRAYCSSTDPTRKECSHVGGRAQGTAVQKSHVEAYNALTKDVKKNVEECIKVVMCKYWVDVFWKDGGGVPTAHEWEQTTGVSQEDSLQLTGAFLVRVAKLLMTEKARACMAEDPQNIKREFATLENKLRQGFKTPDVELLLGPCCIQHTTLHSEAPADLQAVARDVRSGAPSAPPMTFSEAGEVVENTASRVRTAGIEDGSAVQLLHESSKVKKGALGVVTEITCKGVNVLWAEEYLKEGIAAGEAFSTAPGQLKLVEHSALKSKKRKVEPAAPVALPDGLSSWTLASEEQSTEAFKSGVLMALYILTVTMGPGPEELRLVPATDDTSQRQVVVAKKLAAKCLTIVPFSTNFVEFTAGARRPAGAVMIEISLDAANATKHRFHLVPPDWTQGDDTVDPPVRHAVSVWQWLPSATPALTGVKLKCVKHTFTVPVAITCDSIGKIPKHVYLLTVPILTNEAELWPGASLWGVYKPG